MAELCVSGDWCWAARLGSASGLPSTHSSTGDGIIAALQVLQGVWQALWPHIGGGAQGLAHKCRAKVLGSRCVISAVSEVAPARSTLAGGGRSGEQAPGSTGRCLLRLSGNEPLLRVIWSKGRCQQVGVRRGQLTWRPGARLLFAD